VTGTVHADWYTFLLHLAQFFLEREMFQTKAVEKIKKKNKVIYSPTNAQVIVLKTVLKCTLK